MRSRACGASDEAAKVMQVVLRVVDGKANVREIVLGADTVIGRGADCNLKIASSDVSRKHCRVRVRGDQVRVTDLGSSNGTMLDGHPLQPNNEVLAIPGSVLSLGPLKFELVFEAPAPPPASPEGEIEEGMGTWVDAPPNPGIPESFGSSVTNLASAFVTASSYNLPAVTPSPVVNSEESSRKGDSPDGPSEGTLFDLNQKELESFPPVAPGAATKPSEKKGWGWWGGKSKAGDQAPPPAPRTDSASPPSQEVDAVENDSVLRAGTGTVSDPELFREDAPEAPFDPFVAAGQRPAKANVDPEFGAALDAFLKQS
jgi:predicted component of type VI protein secretion system